MLRHRWLYARESECKLIEFYYYYIFYCAKTIGHSNVHTLVGYYKIYVVRVNNILLNFTVYQI